MNKSTQKQEMHVNADLTHNVHVIVAKRMPNGKLKVSTDRMFKNTATRLMTQSIAEFLAGSEHSYNRKSGRPNFISFGTMGIKKQPDLTDITPDIYGPNPEDPEGPPVIVEEGNWREYLEERFTDVVFDHPEDRTRPWYESTSLALTDTCGASVTDEDGHNIHFWNPELGWNNLAPGAEEDETFQGELCTEYSVDTDKSIIHEKHDEEEEDKPEPVIIKRPAILRADVSTNCPQDLDYGKDGYCSTVVFYGYASAKWVNDLLEPQFNGQPVGTQLHRMAISEFGLYEKSNEDPHGMYTLFAGFRVPEIKDIVYVSKDEVVLVEWRVTIRALMPFEMVQNNPTYKNLPTGISIDTTLLSRSAEQDKRLEYRATAIPISTEQPVINSFDWLLTDSTGQSATQATWERVDARTAIVTIPAGISEPILYMTASHTAVPDMSAKSAIITGLLTDYIYGINVTATSVDINEVQLVATVLGVGQFSTNVVWEIVGIDDTEQEVVPEYTHIDQNGLITIDSGETLRKFKITANAEATRYEDEGVVKYKIHSVGVLARIGQTEGPYVISDFTILT